MPEVRQHFQLARDIMVVEHLYQGADGLLLDAPVFLAHEDIPAQAAPCCLLDEWEPAFRGINRRAARTKQHETSRRNGFGQGHAEGGLSTQREPSDNNLAGVYHVLLAQFGILFFDIAHSYILVIPNEAIRRH